MIIYDRFWVVNGFAHFVDQGSESDRAGSSRPLITLAVLRLRFKMIVYDGLVQYVLQCGIAFGHPPDLAPELLILQVLIANLALFAHAMQFSLAHRTSKWSAIHGMATIRTFVDICFLPIAHLCPMTMNLV